MLQMLNKYICTFALIEISLMSTENLYKILKAMKFTNKYRTFTICVKIILFQIFLCN